MDIKQVQERFIQEYFTSDSGITGVGIGCDDSGQPCLRVNVLDETRKSKIPTQFGNVTVTVIVTGTEDIRAF